MASTDSTDHTLSGEITVNLRDAIITGQIAQGSRLSETKLAKEMNVSRGPLREAIRRLEGMNLIHYIPQQGARVVELDINAMLNIYDAREVLEARAAKLAATNMASAEIDSLNRIIDTHSKQLKESPTASVPAEHDYIFHETIIKGSKNGVLQHLLFDELYHVIKMFRHQNDLLKSTGMSALIEHKQIMYAIEQRDPILAEVTMQRHIATSTQRMQQRLKKQ